MRDWHPWKKKNPKTGVISCIVTEEPPLPEPETPQATIVPKNDAAPFTIEPPHIDPLDIAIHWPRFLEKFIEDRPNIGTFLSLAKITETTESSVAVKFDPRYSFQFAEMTKKETRDCIKQKLKSFFGRVVEIHINIEKKTDEQSHPASSITPAKVFHPSLEDDIDNEPIIRHIMEIFDGEII